ncbi:MAG: RluA family pseudouridine synthase [Spirochaetales bacterium]|nr:RluA family pseudouridine synthase [Leptospiraceae bacterium]MCP5483170.1 RluA family pseudouridine synthase [Spirochaetales bacterium]MCP5486674.1 RluA family pseudouridine synthase [Spirochaetales bacterium]
MKKHDREAGRGPPRPLLPVLFEDNHLLVIEKPAGVLSQGDGSGRPDVTVLASDYIRERYSKPGAVYVGLVHRLDREVGGVMVLARTSKAAARLSEQFRARKVRKIYRALVLPGLPEAGDFQDELTRGEHRAMPAEPGQGQDARLHYERLAQRSVRLCTIESKTRCDRETDLLRVEPETGRYHQIRFQFSVRGHPLLGDRRYGARIEPAEGGIALYCAGLEIVHPVKREPMLFSAVSLPAWAAGSFANNA